MTVDKTESYRVLGGQYAVSASKLTKVLSDDPVMAKLVWNKQDRHKVLSLVQSRIQSRDDGVTLLIELFQSIGPIQALFKVSDLDLLTAAHRCGHRLLPPVLPQDSDSIRPAKRRKKTNNILLCDIIKYLYHKESPHLFQILKAQKMELSDGVLKWMFGLKNGELPVDYFLPYLMQLKLQQPSSAIISAENQLSKVTRQALLASDNVSNDYISICGIPIRTGTDTSLKPSLPLSETIEVIDSMRDICIGLSASLPLIIIGPIGSGKTHLINYVAQATRNSLISYQLRLGFCKLENEILKEAKKRSKNDIFGLKKRFLASF